MFELQTRSYLNFDVLLQPASFRMQGACILADPRAVWVVTLPCLCAAQEQHSPDASRASSQYRDAAQQLILLLQWNSGPKDLCWKVTLLLPWLVNIKALERIPSTFQTRSFECEDEL